MSIEGLIKLCAWGGLLLALGLLGVHAATARHPKARKAGFIIVIVVIAAAFIWGLGKVIAGR
jgi:membrane protein DedA with SNARE-associated domain